MSNYKRETTRKQAQTVTTVHGKDLANLPEKLKNMVEELEIKLERDKSKNNE